MSVLLVNFPMAIIIMSFDEVYKIRKGREERAALVVDRLFKWSDRHRGKRALINGNNNKVNPASKSDSQRRAMHSDEASCVRANSVNGAEYAPETGKWELPIRSCRRKKPEMHTVTCKEGKRLD